MGAMNLSRRSFLGGALALVAATALPADAFAQGPLIVGDGVHDDTAGLQALLDGQPFRVAGSGYPMQLLNDGRAVISGGNFAISDTLCFRGTNVLISDSMFHMTSGAECFFHFEGAKNVTIFRCHMRTPTFPHQAMFSH